MNKVTYDKVSRRHIIITALGITALVFLILVSIVGAKQDSMIRNNKGNVQTDLNKIDESINAYGKTMALESHIDHLNEPDKVLNKSDEAVNAYVNAFKSNSQKLDNFKKSGSLKGYDKEIETNPNDSDAWYNKGNALSRLGKLDEAIKAYDKAIEFNPQDSKAWNTKGDAFSQQGKYDEALKAYEKAVEIDPKNPDAWNSRGAALANLGKYDEAIKAYGKANDLNK